MDTLTITDDEAAALALSLPDAWRAPLPTVDQSSKERFAAAVFRGRRSLVVRDLAHSDGTPVGLAAEVAKRLGLGLRAMFLLADGDDNWVARDSAVCLYGTSVDAIELSHVIAGAGVHYFKITPPPGQWQALTGLAETIYVSGFETGTGGDLAGTAPGDNLPAAAYLHVPRPDGLRSIRVASGTVTSGRGPVPARFPTVREGVSWLLA